MSYPGERFGVPEDLVSDYMNILTVGSATSSGVISDKALKVRIDKLGVALDKIMTKHLSDSPSLSDKRKFNIELLETALALAKGEFSL